MLFKNPLREAAWIARCLGRGELAPLSQKDVELIARSIEPRRMEPGERLFAQGDRAQMVWIVREGEIELAVKGEKGRRTVVQVLHARDVIGDIEMLLGTPHAYGAWAGAESAVVLGLRRKDFDALIAGQPRFARRWLGSLAARLERSQRRISSLLDGDLRRRAADLLLQEAEGDLVRLPQATLAELIGARRPSLNRVLKELETAGLIALSYRRISIRDGKGLERIASGRASSPAA